MKLIVHFTLFLVVGLVSALPPGIDEDIFITKECFPDSLIKYRSKHDIVNIFLPFNYLNILDDVPEDSNVDIPFFFVEADVNENGKRIDKGLYIFKDNKATKLLENGRDAAANDDTPTQVYFAAQDGIYLYKEETNAAIKYGSISDSIIGIAKPSSIDAIYILTEDNELFNVTDAGTKKTKIEAVVGAKQFVLDYSNNLYFYGEDKQIYVLTADGVKKIEGLPANPKSVTLIKPPIVMTEGVPAIVDNAAYLIHERSPSEAVGVKIKPKVKTTAYSMESVLFQYYAYNKNIYEYKIMQLVNVVISGEYKDFVEYNSSKLQTLATKTREIKSKKKHA